MAAPHAARASFPDSSLFPRGPTTFAPPRISGPEFFIIRNEGVSDPMLCCAEYTGRVLGTFPLASESTGKPCEDC